MNSLFTACQPQNLLSCGRLGLLLYMKKNFLFQLTPIFPNMHFLICIEHVFKYVLLLH